MYSNVEEKATNMTESIKHAIVLLQVNFNPIMDPILVLPFKIGLGPSAETRAPKSIFYNRADILPITLKMRVPIFFFIILIIIVLLPKINRRAVVWIFLLLTMKILISVWSVQHPNACQNIQQASFIQQHQLIIIPSG